MQTVLNFQENVVQVIIPILSQPVSKKPHPIENIDS